MKLWHILIRLSFQAIKPNLSLNYEYYYETVKQVLGLIPGPGSDRGIREF